MQSHLRLHILFLHSKTLQWCSDKSSTNDTISEENVNKKKLETAQLAAKVSKLKTTLGKIIDLFIFKLALWPALLTFYVA